MKSSRILASAVLLLVAIAMAAPAIGGAEFLSYGYARYNPEPSVVGAVMEVYGVMTSPGGMDDPLYLDWDNFEYTCVVTGMVTTHVNAMGWLLEETFAGGIVSVYEDNGTPADYATPATFTDGTLILQAAVADGFATTLLDFDGDTIFAGFGVGSCDWNGGSRYLDLLANEYYLTHWIFNGSPIEDNLNGGSVQVPAGFDRLFNVKITPPNDPTRTVPGTWGEVRRLYR